jgi:hypothetical protein
LKPKDDDEDIDPDAPPPKVVVEVPPDDVFAINNTIFC